MEDLLRFARLIKSLNLAKNVEETKLVFFPTYSSETLLLEQLSIGLKALKSIKDDSSKCLAYYHYESVAPTGLFYLTIIILCVVIASGIKLLQLKFPARGVWLNALFSDPMQKIFYGAGVK